MPVLAPPRLPDEALLRDGPDGPWWLFTAPRSRWVAHRVEEVRPRLAEAARRVEQDGLWAVGWLAYEAGPAFDPALAAHPANGGPDGLPLLHLTLYPEPERLDELPGPGDGSGDARYRLDGWRPSVSRRGFDRAFAAIREALAAGDSYQVNYSLRLRSRFAGDPYPFFLDLARGQQAGHAAFLGDGRRAVACASPELFFRLDGDLVTCRPMKGTAPRGRTTSEDADRAAALATSSKDRAENLMIVDMIRNDLGRVARPGTVRPEALFTVERYPTVLQMTSTVTAETGVPVEELFAALFPCASITGAPKIRTTALLRELEPEPRGVYTGAVGYLAPGRRACWGVAIRTAVVDLAAGNAEYGVGGGIVADSTADAEWEETRIKARVLAPRPRDFELLETLRWEPEEGAGGIGLGGYLLLPEHLKRLRDSAAYFGFSPDLETVERELANLGGELSSTPDPEPCKVRLRVGRTGGIHLEAVPLPREETFTDLDATLETALDGGPGTGSPDRLRVVLAPAPVDSSDPFLFHKTTHRRVYEEALAAAREIDPETAEVLLWNGRGEITETTRYNVAVRYDGLWRTPPVACGLLAGTLRARWVGEGRIREEVLTPEALARAEAVALFNSVRGARRAEIHPPPRLEETPVSAAGPAEPAAAAPRASS
jgi:para-aminobenzoate synthetase/4-amino-4-deoxychorismate lyase